LFDTPGIDTLVDRSDPSRSSGWRSLEMKYRCCSILIGLMLWPMHAGAQDLADPIESVAREHVNTPVLAPEIDPSSQEAYLRVSEFIDHDAFFGWKPVHQRMLVTFANGVERGDRPAAPCFAPGTDPKLVGAFQAVIDSIIDPNGERFNQVSRWGSTALNPGGSSAQGTPTTLTYGFVPDGTWVPSEGASSQLYVWMNGLYGTPADWQPLFHQVFAEWGELSGVTYIYEPNDDGRNLGSSGGLAGVRPDIRIAAAPIDGNSGVLAYNWYPSNGDMLLDVYDSFYNFKNNNSRRLRNTVAHEHGHGFGAAHVCPIAGKWLMEPFINTSFDGPELDDILNIQRHYGDNYEPNDNAAQAADLTQLPSGLTTLTSVSCDDNSDQDWYMFSIAGPMDAFATVTPVGAVYDSSTQNCGGSSGCCAGNIINTLQLNDLGIQIVDSNGSTILDTSNANGPGQPDTVISHLPAPGDYYVHVFSGSSNAIQLYQLDIELVDAPNGPCAGAIDCDDGDPCNGLEYCTNGVCLPGSIVDCNTNDIDDACDIASGYSQDCNGNGIPDLCDFASGFTLDCNNNGIPDSCDIASGFDPDCNGNSIPDTCDILSGLLIDCNNNGLADACDIASGIDPDCNANMIPDSCDLSEYLYNASSGELSPIGFGAVQTHVFMGVPDATTDVTLAFLARGDFELSTEKVSVFIGGTFLDSIFINGSNCASGGDADSLTVPMSIWNNAAAVGGRDVEIKMTPSSAVGVSECGSGSYISVDLGYSVPAFSQDADQNGIPDECGGACSAADVTTTGAGTGDPGYGVPDNEITGADIQYFVNAWVAQDAAIADVTTTGAGTGDPGYGVPDAQVTGADINFYVNLWIAGCP